MFNITWTSLPIFLFGLLEQNIPAAVLLNNPQLYKRNTKNNRMAFREFLLWFLYGLWHSLTVFFGWYCFFDQGLNLTTVGEEIIKKFIVSDRIFQIVSEVLTLVSVFFRH